MTLLPAEDAPGGLQVKLRNGGWADVVPPTGSFVVNIGDLMAVWTNDRRVSHLHRVANPPVTAGRSSLQCWGSLCSPPTCA
ncbi:MAG: isopenicillin N synthase family oxygenase [Betaproteobacteria bacterium]|nr:isopenicillin N synthase family oxygenase [Betaproteobacteria bacterium]